MFKTSDCDEVSVEILRLDLTRQCYPEYYRLVQLALMTLYQLGQQPQSLVSLTCDVSGLGCGSHNAKRLSSWTILNIESDLTAKLNQDDIT